MTIEFATGEIPRDESPPFVDAIPTADWDPLYPGSTEHAPYGFFDDGRPRKRKPKGTGTPRKGSKMPANDNLATTAAGLLARANDLVGMSLMAFGMPLTGQSITDANKTFEAMATEALRTDPVLCRKILSTGATGGKAGLVMAYSLLAVNIYPTARDEMRDAKARREVEAETDAD